MDFQRRFDQFFLQQGFLILYFLIFLLQGFFLLLYFFIFLLHGFLLALYFFFLQINLVPPFQEFLLHLFFLKLLALNFFFQPGIPLV